MKAKKLMVMGIIVIVMMTFTSIAFGQITWYTDGLGMSSKAPGKVSTDTLRFILGTNSELTKNQTLTLDFSPFQVITSEVTKKSNYDFSLSPSASSYETFSMDSTDWSLTYNSTDKELTFTLLTDNSLLPGDSTVLVISSVLANPGRAASSTDQDVSMRVKSSDQPVFSRSEYERLDAANDQVVGQITFADTNASETTYVTVYDTAEGRIPKNGIVKVAFPTTFTFASGIDTSYVSVRDDGVKLTLSSVSAASGVVTINLNASSAIEDGSVLQINLGTSSKPMVINPVIFNSTYSYGDLKTFTAGRYNDFYVAAFDNDGDTLFVDESGGTSFNVVSNWWTDDVGDGGVSLSDYTASNPTELTLSFKLGTQVDFDTNATTQEDWFAVDLSGFSVNATEAVDSTNYTFTGGDWDAATKFHVTYSSDTLYFYPDSASGAAGDNALPAQTALTLVISSNVLTNKGMATDVDVAIKTNHQPTWVTDRDVTAIDPNNGGVITYINLPDTNAGNGSVIDSLAFTANGEIPADGSIRIKFPPTFTLASSISKAYIDTGYATPWNISIDGSTINGGSALTQSAGDIVNNEVILELGLGVPIRSGKTVSIMLGDTSGMGAYGRGEGHIVTEAFTNPAPADSGVYPTVGARSPFVVETRYSDGSLIMSGNNSDDPVTIVTNRFIHYDLAGNYIDTAFCFIDANGNKTTTVKAGDSVGINMIFQVGSYLRSNKDTLYIDLSNFLVDYSELRDSTNFNVYRGTGNAGDNWVNGISWDGTNKIAKINGFTPNDTLGLDTIAFQIKAAGSRPGTNIGGILTAMGARSDLTIRMRTSHQTTWITSDSSLTVVPQRADSASIARIVKGDSVAGETTYDSLFIRHRGKLPPNSKIAIKLDEGFTFGTTSVNTSIIGLSTRYASSSSPSYSVTSPVTNDSLVITVTDTLWTLKNTIANEPDSIVVILGNSANKVITNVSPDSLASVGRHRKYNKPNSSSKAYKAYIYDSDGNLMQTSVPLTPTYSYDDSVGAAVVSNIFDGGPINENYHYSITEAGFDTAGGSVDTLIIPFKIGQTLVPTQYLQLKFSGVTMDADSAAVKDHYIFSGDTMGTSTTSSFTLTITPVDTTIRIQLGTGDSLGLGPPSCPTYLRAYDYACTLRIVNVFRNLGSSKGFKSTVDDIDVWITSSHQATQVQDTTNFAFTVPTYTPNLALTGAGFGSTTPTAGSLADFKHGYAGGTEHGYLPNDGYVDIYFPNKNDSATSSYQYMFTVSDPDSAQFDISGINSYKYSSPSTFKLYMGWDGSKYYDTLGVSYVLYDTLYSVDSSRFRIKLDGSGSAIETDSALVVWVDDQIYVPREATTNTDSANNQFWDGVASDKANYGYRIDLRDKRGYLISKGFYTTGFDVQPGSATKLLTLINGEKHDPGSTTGVRSVPDSQTVGYSIPVAVLLTDQYHNIATASGYATNNVDISLPTNVYGVITDQNGSGTSGDLTLGSDADWSNGEAYYAVDITDSLSILTARDNQSNLGRGTLAYLTSDLLGASLSGEPTNSNSFTVGPQDYAGILVSTFITETYVPGDTANDGKSGAGNDQLSGGATYTVTVYAVDRYYNRVDSVGLGTNGNISASLTSGTGVTLGTVPTTWGADGTATFTIKGSTTGSKTITVSQGSYSGSLSFSVIAAVVKAIFETAPRLSNNAGESIIVTVDTFQFNGSFGSGEGFKLWAHTQKDQNYMNKDAGGALLASAIQEGENGSPSAGYTTTVDSRSTYFQKGQRYYIYATVTALGDSVIGADTTGVVIQRYPYIKTSTIPITPNSANQTLNSGGLSPQVTYDLQYKVVDYDDGTVPVKIFMSKKSTLDTSSVGEDGWLPELQDTTILIKTLDNYDSTYTFSISDTLNESTVYSNNPYMVKGSYYVYVNAKDNDGQVDVEKSSYQLIVKHSPSIGVDRPVSGRTKIDTKDRTHLTINWSTTGVSDLDDEATIAIYYDTTTADHGTSVSSLLASSTKKQITSGFSLTEHQNWPDTLQYDWDLANATSTLLPKAGGAYDFYVLARDDDDTVMAQSPGDVLFYHSPDFNFHFNLGGALSKGMGTAVRQVIVNKGETFRFTWDGNDLDQTQYVRLVVTQQSNYDYEALTFPDEAGVGTPTDAWIVNSTDGSQTNAENVSVKQGSYNWFSGNMTDLDSVDGEYYVMAFVTNNGSYSTWNNSTTEKFQAEGTFKLTGTEATSATDYDIQTVPGIITTNKDDTVRFYIYVDSKGEIIDEVRFNLKVDSTKFEVIDQNSSTAGIQPFKYYTSYFFGGTGITLVQNELDVTTAASAGDSYYRLRFAKVDPAVSGGSVASDEIIASFLLKSKGTDSTTTVYSRVFFEPEDVVLSNDGVARNIAIPSPAVKVYTNPLGRIRGRIPLQGREVYDKIVTVEVRPYGSLIPIDRSYPEYTSANDINTDKNGVQVQTDRDGFFELLNVPNGTYDLVAKVDGWLTGQYREISIVPGDLETGIDPTYDNSAIPVDRGELLAGDVSSGDAAGYPDNVVDEDDITYITSNYGETATGLVEKADINGSGSIDFSDLSWASLNIGKEGVPPVYNKNAGADNKLAYLDLDGVPDNAFENQEFDVRVMAKNVSDLRGYTFTLCYDPDKVEIVNEYQAIEEGEFLVSGNPSNRSIFFTIQNKKGLEFVNVLLGSVEPATGEGVLSTIRMRSLVNDERPDISLVDIMVANRVNKFNRLKDVTQVPDDFGLAQNYPNPFNPETKIRFQLPMTGKVVLKVYNVLGQEVRTLVNNEMKAGYHSIVWDGRNSAGVRVASGIYIYRIKAGKFVASKKMTLLK